MDSGNANGFAMNIELVQKIIAPVTGYLDGMMEIGKGIFRTEKQTAPNDGLHTNNPEADLPEADLITRYGFLCVCFGHPSIIDSYLNLANSLCVSSTRFEMVSNLVCWDVPTSRDLNPNCVLARS
jgi:hypothetical protein